MENIDVIKIAEFIGAQRATNFNKMWYVNNLYYTWFERGTDVDIAYNMIGRYLTTPEDERPETIEEFIEYEMCDKLITIKEFVCRMVPSAEGYNYQSIVSSLVARTTRSASMGSTGAQLAKFLRGKMELIRAGEYSH